MSKTSRAQRFKLLRFGRPRRRQMLWTVLALPRPPRIHATVVWQQCLATTLRRWTMWQFGKECAVVIIFLGVVRECVVVVIFLGSVCGCHRLGKGERVCGCRCCVFGALLKFLCPPSERGTLAKLLNEHLSVNRLWQ